MMIKKAVVSAPETPSEISGRASVRIVHGEALAPGEQAQDLRTESDLIKNASFPKPEGE